MTQKKQFVNINPYNRSKIKKYLKFYEAKGRSKISVGNVCNALEKLAHELGNKNFIDVTQDDMIDFFNNKDIVRIGGRDTLFDNINPFFRWLLELPKKQRPEILDFFEYETKAHKRKRSNPHGIKAYFITPEEYNTIMNYSTDSLGHDKALWETFSLSGFRLGEIVSMKIEDVNENDKGQVEISCPESKSHPRTVPLTEYPHNLMRWLGNHPFKDNKKYPLWITLSNNHKFNALKPRDIGKKFRRIRKNTGIKDTLTPHCFRKTRASIMFNIPKIGNDDKLMSEFFGWEKHTVVDRREEYDLRTHKELMDKLQKSTYKSTSYDTLVAEKKIVDEKLLFYETKNLVTKGEYEKKIKYYDTKFKNIEHNLNISLNPNTPKTQNYIKYFREMIPIALELKLGRKPTEKELKKELEKYDELAPATLSKLKNMPKDDEFFNLVKQENLPKIVDLLFKKKH